MGEIRTKATKHVEVEEDQAKRIHAKKDTSTATALTTKGLTTVRGERWTLYHLNSPLESRKSTNPLRGLPHIVIGHPTANQLKYGAIAK
ncbi:hypothetical protein CR513_23939, partial [Mucuna pruriens]